MNAHHRLMEKHDTVFEIVSAEVGMSEHGHGYVKNRVKLLDGPHAGHEMFYSYRPVGAGREIAEHLGLALVQKDVHKNVGKKFRGRVETVTVDGFSGAAMNRVLPL